MPRPKYHDKPDSTKASIVEALTKVGCTVCDDCDVDAKVWHPAFGPNAWKLVEFKTPRSKNGTYVKDKRQAAQIKFIATHGIPVLTSPETALEWLRRELK
jgi:hypothetical protein